MSSQRVPTFWIVEDTSSYHERGSKDLRGSAPIAIRLYRVRDQNAELVGETAYLPALEGRRKELKGSLALGLLKEARVRKGAIVVTNSRVAKGSTLIEGLRAQGLEFVLALSSIANGDGPSAMNGDDTLAAYLSRAEWRPCDVAAPDSAATFQLAELGQIAHGGVQDLRCIALSTGGVSDYRRSVMVGVTSLPPEHTSQAVAQFLGWTRWIRFVSRRTRKSEAVTSAPVVAASTPVSSTASQLITELTARVNLKIARKLDRDILHDSVGLWDGEAGLKGRLAAGKRCLNVVELFAGAGGMGLGFLMARTVHHRFRILFSGEVDPVFVNTLRVNHEFLRSRKYIEQDDVPDETHATDLRSPAAMERVQSAAESFGGADVVIGGPPCQGFSNANRNSYSSKNPNNKLVDTFVDYVVRLRPRVFIMENVQGILWTPRHDSHAPLSVAEHVASRFAAAGYRIFPKLVDAAWYGVPQHRNRFFLVGIHADLGYAQDDFGEWGPFPRPTHGPSALRPFTTVRQAIEDLPRLANGDACDEMPYVTSRVAEGSFLEQMRRWAPEDRIWDHVTSRHAEYVIERYRAIPEGGNWSSIAGMMTNYANINRTHSNIYHRLKWEEPSITIGHYRKAMLVHPSQHRGLSLREASRLQSFPDWFRFAGGESEVEGGLTYKQQQVGNAVCPLVTKAVAEHLLKL